MTPVWLDTPALPGRIGLAPAPRDPAADLDRLRAQGVDLLVPLLEDRELDELGLAALTREATTRGMSVLRLPIADGGVPEPAAARLVVARIVEHAGAGGRAVVHCRAGLGRTGTIAACCLVALGARPDDAVARVRAARPGAVETDAQERFVAAFAGGTR